MNAKTRKLTTTAILAAVAAVIMHFEISLPFLPFFLKIDASLAIVLISAIFIGPIAVFPIALIKDAVNLFSTTTGGVGQLADFIITVAFALPFALIYKKMKNTKGMILGFAAGTLAIVIAGALANVYILLPFFSLTMPLDKIWEMCRKTNPIIVDMKTYVLYGAMPFNLIKGIIISIITFIVYKAFPSERVMKKSN